MTYSLFIDDERDPINVKWGVTWQENAMYRDDAWIIARDLSEVSEIILSMGMPHTISFDHDLGEGKSTGHDIVKMLVNLSLDSPDKYSFPDNFRYFVHSKNPVGAENIRKYLINYFKHNA